MSYLVLARKYRPNEFAGVAGQEHVTRTLANAIRRGKVAHAYLFSGPRGVGKTSVARIFSKALNCQNGAPAQPCLVCGNCREIAQGTSLAVREIDGASHNSVDNVRELIETFRSMAPPGSKYKIYIIDEVHMLSTAAFNALLKSLEEPPPNTVFILATTEAHKIPETVISRCQRHDFRALTQDEVVHELKRIVELEKLDAEDEVLRMVARLSEGSMRDAQSLLDRLSSFCDGSISAAEAGKLLGVVERRVLFEISASIVTRKPASALEAVQRAFGSGIDPALFLREFTLHWRELFIAKCAGAGALRSVGVAATEEQSLLERVRDVSVQDIQDLFQIARDGADSALRSSYPAYASEALVVRMATREPVRNIAEIIAQLTEKSPSGGGDGSGGRNIRTSANAAMQAKGALPAVSAIKSAGAVVASGNAARDVFAESSQALPQIAAKSVEWSAFVAFVRENGSKVLWDHLMRVNPTEFQPGIFKARGPEFTVSSLCGKDMQSKLVQMLQQYSGRVEWKVAMVPGENGSRVEPGSLRHAEDAQKLNDVRDAERSAALHPNVVALQKVFPGSTIENIKVKG